MKYDLSRILEKFVSAEYNAYLLFCRERWSDGSRQWKQWQQTPAADVHVGGNRPQRHPTESPGRYPQQIPTGSRTIPWIPSIAPLRGIRGIVSGIVRNTDSVPGTGKANGSEALDDFAGSPTGARVGKFVLEYRWLNNNCKALVPYGTIPCFLQM